jgi:hypothetical protein
MTQQLYPKPPRKKKDKSGRRWRVDYDLIYDFGGSGTWSGYHRTKFGALVAAWYFKTLDSWGGTVLLTDQGENDGKESRNLRVR